MLGVLAVARAPLTLEQIMRLGAIRVWRSGADSVLQRLTPFLDELSGTWRYFHPSVAEFLTRGAAQEAPDLGVEGAEWHRRVVGAYRHAAAWDQVDWQSVDDYGILHLAEHLVELGDGGRKEIPALVNPGLRAAARKRFLTDLPFKRIVDTARWPAWTSRSTIRPAVRSRGIDDDRRMRPERRDACERGRSASLRSIDRM